MESMAQLEAIRWARERNIVLPDEFYSMDMVQRANAGTVSRLASLDQIRQVLSAVTDTLESGATFEDFQMRIKKDGIEFSNGHLDNVFRTNLSIAYSHGRWAQQQSTKDRLPYLKYSAIPDSRVRPRHLALNNVIRHIDDPFWDRNYPPLGFRCRCGCTAISEKAALRQGITPDDQLPQDAQDKDWTFHPKNYSTYLQNVIDEQIAKADSITESQMLRNIQQELIVEQQAIVEIEQAFKPLDVAQKEVLDDMVERIVNIAPEVPPSAVRMAHDLATNDASPLAELLDNAQLFGDDVRDDLADNSVKPSTKDSYIKRWLKRSWDSLMSAAKSLKNTLTGNSIKGFDAFNLQAGQVIGIKTPTLFKEAKSSNKSIRILDMRGQALDLSKISNLDGSLLAPDLNLSVVSVTDDLVTLQRTDQVATRLFVANQMLFSMY